MDEAKPNDGEKGKTEVMMGSQKEARKICKIHEFPGNDINSWLCSHLTASEGWKVLQSLMW